MSQQSDDRWQRQWDIFHQVLEVPRDERDDLLRKACANDEALRRAVEELLDAHARSTGVLDRSNALPKGLVDEGDPERLIGERIGPYRLEGVLGLGGMGVVYAAQQEHPMRRRVALKLIKLGMDSRELVARFESERQALAIMNHPRIAKVFDAGITERGRPYFVMEHVPGIAITEYCDLRGLGLQDRLALFVQACAAIQHAHQQGIVHRDIKPSNVLVASVDGRPSLKIIDFGVAKALGQSLTDRDAFTRNGVLIGTPEYMSPEQAGTTSLEVDARTDIYALGVVLYELLAGALPFDPTTLRRAAAIEMMRIIREEEPPKLSVRFASLGDSAENVAKRRHLDVRSLGKQLRGELEWITTRALEKDPDRRYRSAAAFAADVTRHLEHRPVDAGPPSPVYQARKFVRRHRVAVVAAGLVAVLIVAFGAVTTLQSARVARLEGERAEAQAELAGLDRLRDSDGMVVGEVWRGGDAMGQPSPDGRYLSFVDWRTGDIAVRDLETKENRRLTDDGTWENPSSFGDVSIWSPDSRRIAYCWFEGDRADLRIVGLDGSEPRIVHRDPDVGYAWPRAWSRDGKFILAMFHKEDDTVEEGHRDEIVLVSVEDGSLHLVKALGDRHTRRMDLSPDGNMVVYEAVPEAGSEERDLYLVSTDGRQETHLVDDPADDHEPFWTPDGKGILFASDRSGQEGLWLLPVANGRTAGEARLVREMGEFGPLGMTHAGEFFFDVRNRSTDVYVATVDLENGTVIRPPERISERFAGTNHSAVWSPDGEQLAYMSWRGGTQDQWKNTHIVFRTLSTNEEWDLPPTAGLFLNPWGWGTPSWHPDGRSLLVPQKEDEASVLTLIEVANGETRPLLDSSGQPFRGSWGAFTPTGGAVVAVSEDRKRIQAYDLATKAVTTLYEGTGSLYWPTLSPDGRRLAFAEGAVATPPHRLSVMPFDGGPAKLLHELAAGEPITWGPGLSWTRDGQHLLVGRGRPSDGPVGLWRVPTEGGPIVEVMTFPRGLVGKVSLHPDGRRLAFGLATGEGGSIWAMRGFLSGS